MDPASLFSGLAIGALCTALAAGLLARATARHTRERLLDRDTELDRMRADFAAARQREDELERRIAELRGEQADLTATLRMEREAAGEKLALLGEAREKLRVEFENLANRIFEEKGARLTGQSLERLQEVLTPFKDQLGDFRKRVDHVYETEGKERASLKEQIRHLTELNNRISEEATHLTLALKGESKVRGNWGEMILERVLEQSGLVNGREYETQVHLRERHGGQQGRFPDVVVHLPENRDVVIDAKVTLNAYERHVNAETPAQKAAALREHIAAVRNHIKELSAKNYGDLEGIRAMELVLMCVPNESAFISAVAEDPSLHDDAMRSKVVLVGPTTLLLTLKIIEAMWRTEYQNRNALEIAERGKLLYEKFVGFVEDLLAVGTAIDRAHEAHGEAMKKLSTGRGNLANQAQDLIRLGVRANKQLPPGLAEDPAAD